MSKYLNYDCINCGRHRVENNGICEKCNFDNILNEFAQPVLECLEHGAGTCRNADLIDTIRAEIARLKNQVADYLAVNAELVEKVESRDEKIAELEAIVSPASFRKFLVEQIKDPELAEAYVKACIQDTTYKELLAYRDKIITRLKEDGERLASTYVVEVFPHEWVCRGGCHHWARFGEQIDHAPDCPVTLHRALMKEVE
jgi:hypothetical protein